MGHLLFLVQQEDIFQVIKPEKYDEMEIDKTQIIVLYFSWH
jgi:hypothetical protein